MRDEVFLVGRILLSLVFVVYGFRHLTKTEGSTQYAAYKKVPNARLMVQFTGVCMLLAGSAIILGVAMDLAASLTAIMVTIYAFVMHRFWDETDEQTKQIEMAQFMKNVAVAGGALVIAAVTTDATPYTLTDAVF